MSRAKCKSLDILIENVMARISAKGWNQNELARKVGMTPSRISLYLNAAHTPSLEIIETIAQALDVPVSELLRDHSVTVHSGAGEDAVTAIHLRQIQQTLKDISEAHERLTEIHRENLNLKDELAALRKKPNVLELKPGDVLNERERRLVDSYREQPAHMRLALELLATGDWQLLDEAEKLGLEPGEISLLKALTGQQPS